MSDSAIPSQLRDISSLGITSNTLGCSALYMFRFRFSVQYQFYVCPF